MDVHFLHTGEPVLVIEDGEGEPGGYVVGPNRTQVWTDNPDYRPSKVVRLGTVEEVEPGQIAGRSYDDTSTAARAAAIADGSHPDRDDAQFVHEPAQTASTGGSPVVAGDPTAIEPTALGEAKAPGEPPAQTALTDSERDELTRLREQEANRQDPARVTDPAATDTTTG